MNTKSISGLTKYWVLFFFKQSLHFKVQYQNRCWIGKRVRDGGKLKTAQKNAYNSKKKITERKEWGNLSFNMSANAKFEGKHLLLRTLIQT